MPEKSIRTPSTSGSGNSSFVCEANPLLPASPSTIATEAARWRALRAKLVEKTTYLGSQETRLTLSWCRSRRSEILVTKSETDSIAAALRDREKAIEEGREVPVLRTAQPAILSAVVLISEDDCWLSSDGRWKGANSAAKTLADVKLSFVGCAPPLDPFTKDFGEIISTLESLEGLIKTRGAEGARSVVSVLQGGRKGLRMRHRLFEVC
jgi:hypothetical protein